MKRILSIILILTVFPALFAQSKVGTTAANFLTIPMGAKASSMGGAFVAIANDATTIFWNPGGSSRLSKSEFQVAYSEWLVGTSFNWAGLALRLDDDNAIGISINQLNYGEEEITTPEAPNGTGQKWDAQDISLAVTYCKNLTDRFSIGGSIKYIRQQIWNESASAFALDIGLLFSTQLEGLKIGMNISNFGTEMQLDGKDLLQPIDIDPANAGNNEKITGSLNTDSWTLPLTFSVGLGYSITSIPDWQITVASDAVYPNNNSASINLGGEFIYNNMFALRAGYNGLFRDGNDFLLESHSTEGLSAGLGVMYDFGSFTSRVDYSYNNYGIFDEISKLSFTVGF